MCVVRRLGHSRKQGTGTAGLMGGVFKWGVSCIQKIQEKTPNVQRQECSETIKWQLGVWCVSGSLWDIVDPRLVCVESGE